MKHRGGGLLLLCSNSDYCKAAYPIMAFITTIAFGRWYIFRKCGTQVFIGWGFAYNPTSMCRKTIEGRAELGHLYQFIAAAGSCCPNGICAEMVWFTGSQTCYSMTTRTQPSTLTALSGPSPVGKLSTPLLRLSLACWGLWRLHLHPLTHSKGVHLGSTDGVARGK